MTFDSISYSIQQMGKFSTEEVALIHDRLRVKTLSKNQFLLEPGQVCQAAHLVKTGAIRQYKIIDHIDELTLNLYPEQSWVLDHKSFTSQNPSENYIQAVEETEVMELNMHTIHELIGLSPIFFQLGKVLDLAQYDLDRYNHLKSPEEKYLDILNTRPTLLQKFPLKYLASYLGMTPETLSRVRKKIRG